MRFLVDADVLSESTKPAPDVRVVEWLRGYERDLAVSPVILGELEYGILLLPAGRRRTRLEHWFAGGVQRLQFLDFYTGAVAAWARPLVRLKRQGHAMPVKDCLIAATALAHKLKIAPWNTVDFQHAGVALENPLT